MKCSVLEISENEARKDFSKAERIDYARRLERIESLKAEKRMKSGKADPMETFPQGTTRDIVASKLGIGSGKQYEKEKYIVDNKSFLSLEDFADWDFHMSVNQKREYIGMICNGKCIHIRKVFIKCRNEIMRVPKMGHHIPVKREM